MKPITGLLKWRLQERARAEVDALKPPMMLFTPPLAGDLPLMDCGPGGVIMEGVASPRIEFILPRPQPAWRHVTQRRNQ